MSEIRFRIAKPSDATQIANCHWHVRDRYSQGIFLSLGEGFLRTYYKIILDDPWEVVVCAEREDGKIVGFTSATIDGRAQAENLRKNRIRLGLAVVGLYFYPNKVVDVAKHIKPSARGELEITTMNQEFLKDGELKIQLLGRGFAWLDTGTHDSLAEASAFVKTIEKRQGLKIACLEGIAYRKGWITEERMMELAKPMLKNQYGQYLLKVIDEMKEEITSDSFRNI